MMMIVLMMVVFDESGIDTNGSNDCFCGDGTDKVNGSEDAADDSFNRNNHGGHRNSKLFRCLCITFK